MDVLGIIPQYPPWSRVGSWLTTHDYLAGMATRGHRVHVVTLQGMKPDYDLDGVHVHANGSAVPSPDVVISHLGDNGHGGHHAIKCGVPSVVMAHGYGNRFLLERQPPALTIFPSKALADDMEWDGPQAVAHPPIFPERYKVRAGKAISLMNLSVQKGGQLFGCIAQRHPELEFLGVEGYGQQVTRQPPNVEIIPPAKDVRAIYRRTRILVMPSERESFGRVALEAACSGIPTVAHPSPGLVEAMGNAATWVDRTDRYGWFAAIDDLLDPKGWRKASARARGAVQADPQATVDRVCRLIEAAA